MPPYPVLSPPPVCHAPSVLQYPADAQPATEQELSFSLTDRPSAINSLQYSCKLAMYTLLAAAALMVTSWLQPFNGQQLQPFSGQQLQP